MWIRVEIVRIIPLKKNMIRTNEKMNPDIMPKQKKRIRFRQEVRCGSDLIKKTLQKFVSSIPTYIFFILKKVEILIYYTTIHNYFEEKKIDLE